MRATVLTRFGAVLTLTLVSGVASPSASRADDLGPLPNAGQFVYGARTGGPYVGVVHAVRRTGGVTVLYVSVGKGGEQQAGTRLGASSFLGYGAYSNDKQTTVDSSLRLTRLVDTANGLVYRPIQTPSAPECICTPMNKAVPEYDPTTQLVTFAAAFPALPATVTTVDVDVTGEGLIVPDVPVTDGTELTPTAGTGSAVIMGQGWPKVDVAAAAAVRDIKPFITDLVSRRASQDNSVRSEDTPKQSTIDISSDVLFAVDKASLSSAATARLTAVAAQIRSSAAGQVQVTGYTDDTGSVSHNQGLSERRARSVVAALKQLAPGVSFSAAGRGENDPTASNASAAGRQLNRRVTVQFAHKSAQ